MKRRGLAIAAVVLAVGVWVAWVVASRDEPPETRGTSTEAPPEEIADPFALFDLADAAVADPGGDATGDDGRGWRRRAEGETEEEWQARRERFRAMRERFRNMSPEERREWLRRRVTITALGDETPQLEPEDVMDAVRSTRRQMRDCVRENGGFRAMRDAMRRGRGDGGMRGRGFSVSFDVSADGALDPESIVLDPPPPEPFYGCFADALASAELPSPEADAHVEMHMGRGGRRGRGGRSRGDGGAR